MIVKEYTEEFYRLDIKSGQVDDDVEKIVRYKWIEIYNSR